MAWIGRLRARLAERFRDTPPDRSPTGFEVDLEAVLAALVTQTQLVNNRLTRLEDRFDELVGADQHDADRQVVLELRLRSARLAAELARVTARLRDQLEARGGGPAIRLDDRSISIVDLTARPAYEPRSGGWQRVD